MQVDRIVEVPVLVPERLTNPPGLVLPALPEPGYRNAGACRSGCYTNAQIRQLLADVVAVCMLAIESLHAIRTYSDDEADAIRKRNQAQEP